VSSVLRLSRTAKVALLVAGVGFLVVCGVWYMNVLRPPRELNLRELGNKHEVPKDPDPIHLHTLAASEAVRRHVLDGDFRIVYRMQDISEDCRAVLDSSFFNDSGTIPKRGEIRFADPGQPAQYGDSLIPDAPFRQLLFAGQGPKTCFLYYQHGGQNHPSYCLAEMDHTDRKMIWVGEARRKADGIEELRSMLSRGLFVDTNGPGC
jgi:hypothetical protein